MGTRGKCFSFTSVKNSNFQNFRTDFSCNHPIMPRSQLGSCGWMPHPPGDLGRGNSGLGTCLAPPVRGTRPKRPFYLNYHKVTCCWQSDLIFRKVTCDLHRYAANRLISRLFFEACCRYRCSKQVGGRSRPTQVGYDLSTNDPWTPLFTLKTVPFLDALV